MNYKILLSLGFVLSCVAAVYSQTDKGYFRVGGNLDFNNSTTHYTSQYNSNNGDLKTFSLTFSPAVSYFVSKGFSVGVVAPFNTSSSNRPASTNGTSVSGLPVSGPKSTSLSLGPVVRYYFLQDKFAFFPELSLALGKEWASIGPTGYQPASNTSVSLQTLKAGMGVTYFLSSKAGVEVLVFYQSTSRSRDASEFFSPETTSSSINLSLGFQFYFSKKRAIE